MNLKTSTKINENKINIERLVKELKEKISNNELSEIKFCEYQKLFVYY